MPTNKTEGYWERIEREHAEMRETLEATAKAAERCLRHFEHIRPADLEDTPMMTECRLASRKARAILALARRGEE